MAVREAHPQTLAFGAAAMAACHVGRRPGFVDEDQAFWFQIELTVELGTTRDYQEFRVRRGIMGNKETQYVTTERTLDTERHSRSVAGRH
jgi:hypothetical protein